MDYEDRHNVYKGGGWFFCHGCDNADEYFVRNNAWPKNWNSRTFKCTSNHKDWTKPDFKKAGYYSLKKDSSRNENKSPPHSESSVLGDLKPAAALKISPEECESSSHYSVDTDSSGPEAYNSEDSFTSDDCDNTAASGSITNQGHEPIIPPKDPKIFELETLVVTLQQHDDTSTKAISSLKKANDQLESVLAENYAKIMELQAENDEMKSLLQESSKNISTQKRKTTVAAKNLLFLQEKEKKNVQFYRKMDCKTLIRSVLNEFIKKYQPRTGARKLGNALTE